MGGTRRLFDFAVRPHDQQPPFRQPFVLVGRISYTLLFNTFHILIFHLYYFRQWNFYASFGLYILTAQFILLSDSLVSNSFGRNIENLRKAGYRDGLVLSIMEFNLIGSQFLGYLIMCYVITDSQVFGLYYFLEHFGAPLLGKILVNLSLAELLFALGHSLTHTQPELIGFHIMHHCCTYPSWNTNIIFHPIDLSIEFGGPAVGLLVMHYWVWQDDLALLATYITFQLWYAFDHDETLNFYHIQHHKACDSLYVIYTNVRGKPDQNTLKRQIKEDLALDWPAWKNE